MSLPGVYVSEFVDVLRERGLPVERLVAGLPIDLDTLAAPQTRVALAVCEVILTRTYQIADEAELALSLGARMRVSVHGFLGFAAMTAATAGEALELAVRFASTRTLAISLSLCSDGDGASLALEENIELPPRMRRLIVITLFVGITQWAYVLTGRRSTFVIECAFPNVGYPSRLPDGIQLHFGAPAHRLLSSAAFLATPLVSADRAASLLARAQCERELGLVEHASIPARVRALLADGEALVPLSEIARILKMSPRTLKRKLADAGLTFSEIRGELLRQRALLLLDNRALSVAEIATRLGYSDVANFARAFRKWTGLAPHAYRRRSALV